MEGSAAETDVFVFPKSLPGEGREPRWLRPGNSCYSKTLCHVFHLGGQDGIELFLPDRHCSCPVPPGRDRPCCWGGFCVTSDIRHSQGASSCVPGAGKEGINSVVFVLSWDVAGRGGFHRTAICSFSRKRFWVVLWVKGEVAEVVSWKLGALRSNPALFILGFLQPGEEKALGKPPVPKGSS